jgi:Fur family ferric uptake transcriptional regulator
MIVLMTETARQQIETFLSGKGLRRTKQRDVIVEAAFGTKEHFNAEELHEMARRIDRTISRATVYRTLALLVDCGLLREVDLGRDQTYYDPNFLDKPEHNHLICLDCDRVVEFEDDHIALLEDCITRRLGFTPSSKSIRIAANCDQLARSGACSYRDQKAAGTLSAHSHEHAHA